MQSVETLDSDTVVVERHAPAIYCYMDRSSLPVRLHMLTVTSATFVVEVVRQATENEKDQRAELLRPARNVVEAYRRAVVVPSRFAEDMVLVQKVDMGLVEHSAVELAMDLSAVLLRAAVPSLYCSL